jgi:hypothetical protein
MDSSISLHRSIMLTIICVYTLDRDSGMALGLVADDALSELCTGSCVCHRALPCVDDYAPLGLPEIVYNYGQFKAVQNY